MEIITYKMDFSDALVAGDSLTGTPTVVATPATGITIDQKTLSGTIAQCRVTGGTDGVDYLVRFTCDAAGGEKVEAEGKLKVRN